MGSARRAVGRGNTHWMRTAGCMACLGLIGSAEARGGTPHQSKRDPSHAFDLAVSEVDVRQLSSTSMFREVEVRCVVENRGPRASSIPASVVLSRRTDDGSKVLKKVPLAESLAPGEHTEARADTAAWFANPVTYRCEIQFAGQNARDADPSDDAGEFTYPRP